jgi:diguanylate cyclase (GGDEF)-like protein
VIVFHDVIAARAMSLEITHSAQHDLVTNLPNRLLLSDRISQAIALARRQNRPMAVIFLDLDRFKYINDSLGHATGDQLLQSVSKRLLASVRGSDTVSRQGGDEFVILLSEITFPEDVATSARKLLLSVSDRLHRGTRSAYRWQHRYQRLPGRRRRCRNADQECGHGDVPRQGKGAQQFPVLQGGYES